MKIGIAPGCPAGIGPEVIARAIVSAQLPKTARLVWLASATQLMEGARRADIDAAGTDARVLLGRGKRAREVLCTVAPEDDAGACVRPGVVDGAALASQRDALVRACEAAARGELHGIVTGPVRKKALHIDGVAYPGQTEVVHRYLAKDQEPPLMVFAGGPFILGLLTVHIGLRAVSAHVTAHALDVALARLAEATIAIARKRRPRLVVLGVNPHAGEGGLFGRQDIEVSTPVIAQCRSEGMDISGPVPGDTVFVKLRARQYDAVVAMYHDQGHIPVKLLGFNIDPVTGKWQALSGVNITLGLPIIRTSVDHGTAFDIAGQGIANEDSLIEAIDYALRLAAVRKARMAA